MGLSLVFCLASGAVDTRDELLLGSRLSLRSQGVPVIAAGIIGRQQIGEEQGATAEGIGQQRYPGLQVGAGGDHRAVANGQCPLRFCLRYEI